MAAVTGTNVFIEGSVLKVGLYRAVCNSGDTVSVADHFDAIGVVVGVGSPALTMQSIPVGVSTPTSVVFDPRDSLHAQACPIYFLVVGSGNGN